MVCLAESKFVDQFSEGSHWAEDAYFSYMIHPAGRAVLSARLVGGRPEELAIQSCCILDRQGASLLTPDCQQDETV